MLGYKYMYIVVAEQLKRWFHGLQQISIINVQAKVCAIRSQEPFLWSVRLNLQIIMIPSLKVQAYWEQ